MNKIFSIWLIAVVMVGLAGVFPLQGLAQGATGTSEAIKKAPTPTPSQTSPGDGAVEQWMAASNPEDRIGFKVLGLSEQFLYGPLDTYRLRFSLPEGWKLEEGAELGLVVTAFVVNEAQAESSEPIYSGANIAGALDVSFNNQLITSLGLVSGKDVLYRIPLPAGSLQSVRQDGRHDLYLVLDAGVDCDYDYHRTTVVIQTTSSFIFPHTRVSPPVSLDRLPRPFYQQGAVAGDPAIIVLPDQPSAGELQAALTVMAGLGRMTAGKLAVSLAADSQLDPAARNKANLVYVGTAASLGRVSGNVLAAMELPATISGEGFTAPGMQAADGILQVALSPWDPSKVLLVVGGNSEPGVVKAAQAFSYGLFQTSATPDLAVVAEVRPEIPISSVPVDRTFADLGYVAETIKGLTQSDLYYSFYLPPGQASGEDAFLELVYSHSELVDFMRSGVEIYVNNQPIGNVLLSGDTAEGGRKRMPISPSFLISGENVISIQAKLIAIDECSAFTGDNLWFAVFPESTLHLPLAEASALPLAPQNLNEYPAPFLRSRTLSDLAFVLPQNDPLAWQAAGRLAYDLGDKAEGVLYEMTAVYAEAVPKELLEQSDLILVGTPAGLPFLAGINEQLPGPFDEGSWLAKDPGGRVVYRLPEGTHLAYLELLPSIWNSGRTILAVLGTASEDLAWAVDALVMPVMRNQLFGDFAMIQAERVLSSDSRVNAGSSSLTATPAPETQAELTPTLTPAAGLSSIDSGTVNPAYNQDWIPPAVVGLSALMLIVLGVAVINGRRTARVQAGKSHR